MAGAFELFNDDAVAWLGALQASSARLIVLDPGVPGRAPRREKKGAPPIPPFPEARLPALLFEVHRTLARDGLCWWLCETAHAFRAAHAAERLGLRVGAPVVWDRGEGPGARLGFVLPLSRGRARSPGAELVHAPRGEVATALPQLLCEALIEAGSARGDTILDPFMGSGALGIAALAAGRCYLGNDLLPCPESLAAHLAKLDEAPAAAAARHADARDDLAGDDDGARLTARLGTFVERVRATGNEPAAAGVDIAVSKSAASAGIPCRGQLTMFGDAVHLR